MAFTTPQVLKTLKSMLGAPLRNVELDKQMIEDALALAVQMAATATPVFKWGTGIITKGIQKYDFNPSALNKPFGAGLTRVFDSPITSPQAVFNEFEYYRLRQPPYVDMSELLIDQMYYKEIGNLTGTSFDWEWIPGENVLLFTPTPTRTRNFAYEYRAEPTSISELNSNNQMWVFKYTLALLKEMLGRVRGKFQGVPGTNFPVNTDWADLLREAAEEKARLEEQLEAKGRASWTPPMKG